MLPGLTINASQLSAIVPFLILFTPILLIKLESTAALHAQDKIMSTICDIKNHCTGLG